MTETVSVIIPTYKGAKNLARAIDSILHQTYNSIEIIVVDDNDPFSNERNETEAVMKKYERKEIKYIKHGVNKNGAAARNTGIAQAKGEYICFLDDDDFYFANRVKKSVEILEKSQIYDAVYCSVIITNKSNIKGIIKADKVLTTKDILLDEMVIGTGSNIFLKREVFEVLKGFDESFRRHQDLEFMLRCLEKFKITHLNEFLIVKATNGTNNILDYVSLSKVKNLYFTKFKGLIYNLSNEERTNFYSRQYRELLLSALISGNKLDIKKAVKELMEIREITIEEKLLVILFKSQFFNKKVFKNLMDIKSWIKDKNLERTLNEYENNQELAMCRKLIRQSN